MKFSYNQLQKYFTQPLPEAGELAEIITFHSSEIEEVITLDKGVVFDVKVLPDKSAWLLSHRGLAKELSVILDRPLLNDPLKDEVTIEASDKIKITRAGEICDFYSAALITGVKVGPSPDWLKTELEIIGQRSINNIVDATNYVMFALGQPLHAFSANKLTSENAVYALGVRPAQAGEKIVTLTGETYELSPLDSVIIDGYQDQPIGIAGVKGGQLASVDKDTTAILLECAHFERKAIRQTAKRLKLQTDASKRYENGISVSVAPIALNQAIELILEIAGGELVSKSASGESKVERLLVSVSLRKLNSVLGVSLTKEEVGAIIKRFGYHFTLTDDEVTVHPPFERDDLIIAEDLIEEIGRIYGLEHIKSVVPKKFPLTEYNARHYYAEKIREVLTNLGFSEVYTSSFRNLDEVKIENALASDKSYLRSSLVKNLDEARSLNIFNKDVLGLPAIKIFEIGTVFGKEEEEFKVALAVQTGVNYKAKQDEPLLAEAVNALTEMFGQPLDFSFNQNGLVEFSLEKLLTKLEAVTSYSPVEFLPKITYRSFSQYPAISRDIAMWVDGEVSLEEVVKILQSSSGDLCVRITHLDTFIKDGRQSLAFRLVFQSFDRTLTDVEVQGFMDNVYQTALDQGWETR